MLAPSGSEISTATSAAQASPRPSPPRYCIGSRRAAAPPAMLAYSPTLKNSPRCTTALAYIPVPKKTMLPNEL